MKLRNKKTGAIYDVLLREREVGGYPCIIVCDKKAYRQSKTKFGVTNYVLDEYRSLAEFNEDWEDYKPAEPLIKDEKIRKAVREWAEANEFEPDCEMRYSEHIFGLINWQAEISFNTQIKGLEHDEKYTIEELCGEEK